MAHLSRREFVHGAVAAGAACWAGASSLGCRTGTGADQGPAAAAASPALGGPSPPAAGAGRTADGKAQDTLDEALELLKDTGPEYGGGLANHAPMAAEALCALGRADSMLDWVRNYRRKLREPPSAREPIEAARWQAALGEIGRYGDWVAFFEREITQSTWPATLETWLPRLAPGLVGVAAHGIIRAGHAARGLSARDTPLRRRELAYGLGYWAARYELVPSRATGSGAPPAAGVKPRAGVAEALAQVEIVPLEKQATSGPITGGLRPLAEMPSFAGVADRVDTSGDMSRFLSDLSETFARVYLQNSSHHAITFIHAVTGPSALRLIVPHVRPETARATLRYAWQATAAMYAAYARPAAEPAIVAPGDIQALIDQAVKTGDEHAIKFTEACLREHALHGRPVYLAAAKDAIDRLG